MCHPSRGAVAFHGRRPDLRVARRQRHAGAVGPRHRHADRSLRGRGRASLPHDDRPWNRRPRESSTNHSSWSTPAPLAAAGAGASRHPGGVRLQPARDVAQGRDGPDAADAGHRARAGGQRPYDPEENIRGGTATCGSCSTGTTATRDWHWRPTTPGSGAVDRYGQRCPPIAKRATT